MSRTITATEKHRAVKNGLMAESEFTRQMRQLYPMYISVLSGFKDTVQILKNRGMLYEEVEEDTSHNFSPEALQRGTNAELDKKGIDSVTASEKDRTACEKVAIKKLKKDVLYYLNILSGDSSKVNKQDKAVETKRGALDVDTFNGLKNAELNEGAVKNKIYGYAERIVSEYIKQKQNGSSVTLEDLLAKINAEDATNMGMDYKFLKDQEGNILNALKDMMKPSNQRLKTILNRGIETIKAKYPSVAHEDIIAFIKTHRNDVLGGVDIADEFEEFADANGILVKEPKGGLDKEPGLGAASIADIEAMKHELDPLTGKKIVMFKEDEEDNAVNLKPYEVGDMFSSDFDYTGMLKAGLRVRINTNIDQLRKLYDSFEDVNYHRENRHLGRAIDAIEDQNKSEALDAIKDFKIAISKTIKDISENTISEVRNPQSEDDFDSEDPDGNMTNQEKRALEKFHSMAEVKAAVKVVIEGILNEAQTETLQKYISYENKDNEDLAERIRNSAKGLTDVLEDMERSFLKHKSKVEGYLKDVGSFMSPSLENAFKIDLRKMNKNYERITGPTTRKLSPEELDAINKQTGKELGGDVYSLSESKE